MIELSLLTIFQSTLPYGSDLASSLALLMLLLFQSTLPYGSDHIPLLTLAVSVDFNPRSLTGATNIRIQLRTSICISIHAPLRERRFDVFIAKLRQHISIHAPLRERPRFETQSSRPMQFQSTLPYGSDPIH